VQVSDIAKRVALPQMNLPSSCWGGWRGSPNDAVIHLLFARVWRTDQSGRPDLLAISFQLSAFSRWLNAGCYLLSANSQLRDSVGITPTSPLADRIEL